MKYAPILAFDEREQKWHAIGVIAANRYGVVQIKVHKADRLVSSTPAYHGMEEHYNTEFADGEVTFYDREAGASSSHIVRLKTDDPQFIEKYREQLETARKFVRIGEVETLNSENITEHITRLLDEVRTSAAQRMPVAGG